MFPVDIVRASQGSIEELYVGSLVVPISAKVPNLFPAYSPVNWKWTEVLKDFCHNKESYDINKTLRVTALWIIK
ncbi:hypothetical protein SCA6_009973 [Theobroma cacao]